MPTNLDFLISYGFLGKSPRVLIKFSRFLCFILKWYKRKSYFSVRWNKISVIQISLGFNRVRIRLSFKSTWLALNFCVLILGVPSLNCWKGFYSFDWVLCKDSKAPNYQKDLNRNKTPPWNAGWWTCNITRYKCH